MGEDLTKGREGAEDFNEQQEINLGNVFQESKLSTELQDKIKKEIQIVLTEGGLVVDETIAVLNPDTGKPELAKKQRFGKDGFYVDTVVDSKGQSCVSEYYAVSHSHSHAEAIWTNSKGEAISVYEQKGIAEFDEKLYQERNKLYDEIETIKGYIKELEECDAHEIQAWWGLKNIVKDRLNNLRLRRDAINKAHDGHRHFRG